ncbi:unnamed protein product [Peniophora sp. CBMAI 1063]|nr:unnamed protein product [Peniophora sp. CBMAI 1063]
MELLPLLKYDLEIYVTILQMVSVLILKACVTADDWESEAAIRRYLYILYYLVGNPVDDFMGDRAYHLTACLHVFNFRWSLLQLGYLSDDSTLGEESDDPGKAALNEILSLRYKHGSVPWDYLHRMCLFDEHFSRQVVIHPKALLLLLNNSTFNGVDNVAAASSGYYLNKEVCLLPLHDADCCLLPDLSDFKHIAARNILTMIKHIIDTPESDRVQALDRDDWSNSPSGLLRETKPFMDWISHYDECFALDPEDCTHPPSRDFINLLQSIGLGNWAEPDGSRLPFYEYDPNSALYALDLNAIYRESEGTYQEPLTLGVVLQKLASCVDMRASGSINAHAGLSGATDDVEETDPVDWRGEIADVDWATWNHLQERKRVVEDNMRSLLDHEQSLEAAQGQQHRDVHETQALEEELGRLQMQEQWLNDMFAEHGERDPMVLEQGRIILQNAGLKVKTALVPLHTSEQKPALSCTDQLESMHSDELAVDQEERPARPSEIDDGIVISEEGGIDTGDGRVLRADDGPMLNSSDVDGLLEDAHTVGEGRVNESDGGNSVMIDQSERVVSRG